MVSGIEWFHCTYMKTITCTMATLIDHNHVKCTNDVACYAELTRKQPHCNNDYDNDNKD